MAAVITPGGQSGTVTMYCRKENYMSHYVAVSVLLNEFKAYNQLLVAKETLQSICKHGEEEYHIRH